MHIQRRHQTGWRAAIVAFFTGLVVAAPASAAVIWDFEEIGENVVGTMSGSLDVTDLTFFVRNKDGIGMRPSHPQLWSGPDGPGSGVSSVFDSVTPFGPGGLTLATATTGDLFVLEHRDLLLPLGYTSGTPLSGTLTFAGATFASLGITPGSYVYTLPHDTITLNVGPVSVPAPGPLALLALGLVGLAASRRRKA